MSLIDTHCHLDDKRFQEDRAAVIDRAVSAGVERMVTIGTGDGLPDLEAAIRLADLYEPLWATVGVHPQFAGQSEDWMLRHLESLIVHPKVLAVGEIGLDYHYEVAPRDKQRAVFVDQMAIAREKRKPIVIHTREAWDDTLALLSQYWQPTDLPCILHCFTGGPDEARRALQLGCWISFSGIVTYPKSLEVQEAAAIVPFDRILVETDAPYLAPIPYRGKRNEPSFVVDTARKLAELRGEDFEDFCSAAASNFRRACLQG